MVDGAGRALASPADRRSTGITPGTQGCWREWSGSGSFQVACWAQPWPNTGFGEKGSGQAPGDSQDPHPHAAGARRLPGPVPTRGPAGFHGDPRHWQSQLALRNHLVQPQWVLLPAQAGLMQGRQLGLLQSQTACVSLFPKALWLPAAEDSGIQTLAPAPPRPHRLLSFISASYPGGVLLPLWSLCPSSGLCLEGILQPYPSKETLLQYPLLQEALPDLQRLNSMQLWLGCSTSCLDLLPDHLGAPGGQRQGLIHLF